MVRVSDATGGTPTAASWATASDERNKRSGQLSAEKGRKFHNDLAGYPRQPRMPDKIPARGWKSQGKYPPRTTLPRRPVGFYRVREEPRRLLGHAKRQYVGLPFGLPCICAPGKEGAAVMHDGGRERERWNDKFVHDIRWAELIASLVHDIRREEMICISELYTRQCRSIMIDYFLGTCRSYTTYVGQN